ncbi:hypothetical protein [Dysgonomonas sp. 25]|uniref:hypothetical protein n=1 Tax=Dysgonomonas sp. 25 TaxID=2302933 RepID=UPI0013D37CCF|nr:hypothetical protein [Dysgonomonas sp. 25]NDV68615.1 hypothetical protein [Dysgonomonas sp. 25]
MTLQTQFNEGDTVWLINPKTGRVVEREIAGLRTQSINQEQKTIYCFIKDWCLKKENPTLEDCFWVSEGKIYSSKQQLIASL